MPIQTFNPFPRPVPDSSSTPGFPFGYVPQQPFSTTSSSTTYATVLQLTGAGYIAAIVINGQSVPSCRVTWDDTNVTGDMSASVTSQSAPLGPVTITGHGSADSTGREFGLFFSRNAKVEFKWGGSGAAATILIFYYLAGGGAKKYRSIVVAANPSVGADLVNVSGSGTINYLATSSVTVDLFFDSILVKSGFSYNGSIASVIAAGTSGSTNDRANEKVPFAKQLKITKTSATSATMFLMYTIEVN